MYYSNQKKICNYINGVPDAIANIKGSAQYPKISGMLKFFQISKGVIVIAEISGLPISAEKCVNNIFAFHIHSGVSCTGNTDDPFADVGAHYNPNNCPHPYHAGDMPPLFSANGEAYLAFLSSRFNVEEIIGKTVIIHDMPDDFTTQPSGNSGNKIACGEIVVVRG